MQQNIEINKIYCEPCLDTVSRMPDNFLDCVITSPPYWQLRDYGYEGQWGLEPTYQEYLENLWSLMDAIYPKLKESGTVWVNLGDTYARGTRTKDGTNHTVIKTSKEHHIEPNSKPDYVGLDKCLLLIPHRFAIGCESPKWILRDDLTEKEKEYVIKEMINAKRFELSEIPQHLRKYFTPKHKRWIVRNDIIWAKRNGMPESVTDRFSKKHEYFFFMVKKEKYYFDLDIIRNNVNIESVKRKLRGSNNNKYSAGEYSTSSINNLSKEREYKGYDRLNEELSKTKGPNPGDVSDFWDIPTKGTSANHYAAYNEDLIKIPILAGCPEGGIIYDPFMGIGTTAICAIRSNRKFIGSEMSEEYCKIAEKRLKALTSQLNLF